MQVCLNAWHVGEDLSVFSLSMHELRHTLNLLIAILGTI